jgi:tripartite-type tricarboxylate transporter receptor subunit TctC
MLYAPASTQGAALDRLRRAAAAALAAPEVAGKLQEQGIEQRAMAAGELVAFNRAELDKWGALVKRAGAQVD